MQFYLFAPPPIWAAVKFLHKSLRRSTIYAIEKFVLWGQLATTPTSDDFGSAWKYIKARIHFFCHPEYFSHFCI